MTDAVTSFADFLLRVIEFVWPGHQVHAWQRGVLLRNGRFVRELEPGTYWLLWWFEQLVTVDMTPESKMMYTQTITTQDGGTLTFALSHEFEVFDAQLAALTVSDHEGKAHVDAVSAVARTLSNLDNSRFDPERRSGVVRLCTIEVNKRLNAYGMRCNDLEFPVFVRNMRNYRHWQST